MYVAKPDKGYSASINFVDPGAPGSQRWHGNGLRLRNLNGTRLDPSVVVRNVSAQASNVNGRILYTRPDGDVGTITLPSRVIPAGKTRAFDLKNLIDNANLPNSVSFGGIEIEYDTPKGSIFSGVQSTSRDGKHVFQVPMFDPTTIPSSAAGFPWKVDGDFTTVVYVKNETDVPRKFTIHLLHEFGQYSVGVKHLKPRQTVAIDFRELRDNQTPDSLGNLIPLNAGRGQIAWSSHGREGKVLSGRSEQISLSGAVASTYSCLNCCENSYWDSYLTPIYSDTDVGQIIAFRGQQVDKNCFNMALAPYTPDTLFYDSADEAVASIDSLGDAEALTAGDTFISASWEAVRRENCVDFIEQVYEEAPMSVASVSINVPTQANDGSSVSFSATVSGDTPTGYEWTFTAPSGSGNSPDLSFSSSTAATTNASAKWFANPNDACSASADSTYTVKVKVTFANRGPITKQASFKVSVPWSVAGSVNGTVVFSGSPTTQYNSATDIWSVTGPGNLAWGNNNPAPNMNVPSTSQFYSKTYTHEMEHVAQWGQNGLFGSKYTVAGLYAAIQGISHQNNSQFNQLVQTARDNYMNSRLTATDCNNGEMAAHAVSDPINPQFRYQRCGRTSWQNCASW